MAIIISERNEANRFKMALDKIEDGYREIRQLSDQMRVQYGERGTAGDRDGDGRYNERYHEFDRGYGERDYYNRDGGYGERRDSMGRYR